MPPCVLPVWCYGSLHFCAVSKMTSGLLIFAEVIQIKDDYPVSQAGYLRTEEVKDPKVLMQDPQGGGGNKILDRGGGGGGEGSRP